MLHAPAYPWCRLGSKLCEVQWPSEPQLPEANNAALAGNWIPVAA